MAKDKKCITKLNAESFSEENGIEKSISCFNQVSNMTASILNKEFPAFKDNTLLRDMLLYAVYRKAGAVQTAENVL